MDIIDGSAKRELNRKFVELTEFADKSRDDVKGLCFHHSQSIALIDKIDAFMSDIGKIIDNEIDSAQRRAMLSEIQLIAAIHGCNTSETVNLVLSCLRRFDELGYIKFNKRGDENNG